MKGMQFDRKKPYNDLPDLPIQSDVIDKEVLMQWGISSRALAELNRNILRMPNPSMLVNTISLQEAQSSTAIENIFTTEDELYKAVSDTMREKSTDPSTKEVLRYREALWEGYNLLENDQQINDDIVLATFRKIKNTTQGFRPPQSQVVIKRGDSDLRPGEVIYTPPRGEGVIENNLGNLYQFLNDDTDFDPLIKMAIAHYQFEAIHPFTDGNGRTGRILNLLYLVQQGLLSHPVLYLSKYIIENKEDYYHLLSGVTQRNAWRPWILYLLKGVEITARTTNEMIDSIIDQMKATYDYVRPKLNWYSLELNHALFAQPYVKQRTVGEITGSTSRTTLVKYMDQLTELGVLSSQKDGREVFYINNDLVRILKG